MIFGNNYPLGESGPTQEGPMSWLLKAYDHRQMALNNDGRIDGLTKKFIIPFGHSKQFPFPHDRVRLKPMNRYPDCDVVVSGLRFPESQEGIVFVSWELQDGSEDYFLLTPDQFSKIDINEVFSRSARGEWLAEEAITAATDEDESRLMTVLNGFEPDLQNNRANLTR